MASMSYEEIMREAMALSDEERGRMAAELWESIEVPEGSAQRAAVAQAWEAEIAKRCRELDANPEVAIDGESFLREMRARFG